MTISVGRGIGARNTTIDPSNRGLGQIAAARLQNTVNRANRRHQEALSVDGLHAHVWIKRLGGLRCTCTIELANEPPRIEKDRDEGMGADVDFPGAGRTGPTVRVIEVFRERTGRVNTPAGNDLRNIVAEAQADRATRLNQSDETADSELDAIVAAAEALHGDQDSASRGPALAGTTLAGVQMSRCGICLGTGRVEGYQLHGGQRVVLDASGTWPFKADGWTMDHTRPRGWYTDPGDPRANIEWTVELPTYFRKAVVRARNNVHPAIGVVLEYKSGSDAWARLTDDSMNSRRGQNNLLLVRVRPEAGITQDGTLRFTHIEMHFEFIEMPRADMPQLALNDGLEYYEPIINSNMELVASVPGVERGSVIGEDRHGHLWKVTDVTNHQTGQRQLFNIELQLRMLQRWELLYLLNLYRRSDLRLGGRRDVQSVHSDSGRETMQGGPADDGAPSPPLRPANPNNIVLG